MKLRTTLILISLICIILIGYGFYNETLYIRNNINEFKPPAQNIPQDIIHLETFSLPNEIIQNARVVIIHDNKRNITCYLYNRMTYGGGISCIPDSEIKSSAIRNNYKNILQGERIWI